MANITIEVCDRFPPKMALGTRPIDGLKISFVDEYVTWKAQFAGAQYGAAIKLDPAHLLDAGALGEVVTQLLEVAHLTRDTVEAWSPEERAEYHAALEAEDMKTSERLLDIAHGRVEASRDAHAA